MLARKTHQESLICVKGLKEMLCLSVLLLPRGQVWFPRCRPRVHKIILTSKMPLTWHHGWHWLKAEAALWLVPIYYNRQCQWRTFLFGWKTSFRIPIGRKNMKGHHTSCSLSIFSVSKDFFSELHHFGNVFQTLMRNLKVNKLPKKSLYFSLSSPTFSVSWDITSFYLGTYSWMHFA